MRDLQALLPRSTLDKGGYCMPHKRALLHRLVATRPVACAVEIGVFRGSSFLVLAEAMEAAAVPGSRLYGIDPWHAGKARNHIPDSQVAAQIEAMLFTQPHAWDEMHAQLLAILESVRIEAPRCKLIRAESTQVDHIRDVDLLHIDGNHDRAGEDLRHWLPRMAPNGIVVMDDCDWPAVDAAIDAHLRPHARLLEAPGGWSVWEVA